jgi:hypothetical protein
VDQGELPGQQSESGDYDRADIRPENMICGRRGDISGLVVRRHVTPLLARWTAVAPTRKIDI